MKKKIPDVVGISTGDLNGIGIELVLKVFSDKRILDICTPVVYATSRVLSYYKKIFNIDIPVFGIQNASKASKGKLNVVQITKGETKITPGVPSKQSGEFAAMSLQAAVNDIKNGYIDKLITAPIDKHNIQSSQFNFPGHTEYFAHEFGEETLMILMNEEMKVAVLTGHVPLAQTSSYINIDLIKNKARILHRTLMRNFGIAKPKIALLGLNPHSGDNGLLGKEEVEIFRPAVQSLQDEGVLIFGPYAADAFFGKASYKNYDAVLAYYHDQGLAPFKALSFGSGVNFTAGLPFVRTSPDHGTAFDIAGKNIADPSSFREAIFSAIQISRTRMEYNDLIANKL